MNPKGPDSVDADGFDGQNLANFGDGFSETPKIQQPQPPQQHKKQVRRRLHTSRPYQERLINMAEARREIVTALKFHRAAMKQANEQNQQQQQESKMKSRINPRIYASSTNNFPYSSFSQHYPPPNPYSSATDTLNFNLPNQTLGLNLNFHDLNNIDTKLYHNSSTPSICSSSSSSPSSSSSQTLSAVTEEVASVALPHEVGPTAVADSTESYSTGGGLQLHHAMDDEEMAEIRSLGEQHEMEWNDTMNLVTSAWWFKFLKSMESDQDDDGYQPFDQVILEFPAWLNANDTSLQQYFNDLCPDDYFQDPTLSIEIGEIEVKDGESLA